VRNIHVNSTKKCNPGCFLKLTAKDKTANKKLKKKEKKYRNSKNFAILAQKKKEQERKEQ
jgi:hypothetical protein